MVAACDDAGVRLFVVKQNRRNPHPAAAQERGRQAALRPHLHGQRQRVLDPPAEYYDSAAWRGTWEFDGGAFMNQASHYVDLLDWIVGPVESVKAYTGTLARNIEVEDTGVAALWRNGAHGLDERHDADLSEEPGRLDHHPRRARHGAHRRRGRQRDPALGVRRAARRWTARSTTPATRPPRSTASATRCTTTTSSRSLRGEAEPETDGREGLKSLELLIATYLSARDGKRVNLPLEY